LKWILENNIQNPLVIRQTPPKTSAPAYGRRARAIGFVELEIRAALGVDEAE
jgi:hypothetical protein